MKTVQNANAKINLYLDVVGRRENGYHDIVSIMQTVSLSDTVTVEWMCGEKNEITLTGIGCPPDMPTDEKNLACRAAKAFLEACGKAGRVHITLEKFIPMAGGLAGGSADAAAVLRGMNTLCGNPFTERELCRIGAKLGADIPFCIVGGAALVSGIGDCMEAIPPLTDVFLVVARQGEGVSTPWAYGRLDEKYMGFTEKITKDHGLDAILQSLQKGDFSTVMPATFNLFEEAVTEVQPYVEILKSTMRSNGADIAMMSGSGPSVFGIFKAEEDAVKACHSLIAGGAVAFVCTPTEAYTNTI